MNIIYTPRPPTCLIEFSSDAIWIRKIPFYMTGICWLFWTLWPRVEGAFCPFLPHQGGTGVSIYHQETPLAAAGWLVDQSVQSGGRDEGRMTIQQWLGEETGGRGEMSEKGTQGCRTRAQEISSSASNLLVACWFKRKIASSRSHCCLFAIYIFHSKRKSKLQKEAVSQKISDHCVHNKMVWTALDEYLIAFTGPVKQNF